jgi:AcrR family transcriptional regulator
MGPVMGRPARFDADQLLDDALALAAEGGPEAVTMAAVAQRAGAPSGSLYHRFAGRPALLAALWLRTVADFQAGYLAALEDDGVQPREAAVAAARLVVAYSRAHPDAAAVLLQGATAFGAADWPAAALETARGHARDVDEAVRRLAGRLGLRGAEGRERVTLAVVDVPYAVVRRHLRAAGSVPPRAERQVAAAVAAILAP